MCNIISVAVHPTTLEVFSKEGMWHHTDICNAYGLEYDKMFKPDIILSSKKVVFNDGDIALKRTVPDDLVRMLLKEMELEGDGSSAELRFFHKWQPKHEAAVQRWIQKEVPDARGLIGYSEHTFNPLDFKKTLKTTPATAPAIGVMEASHAKLHAAVAAMNKGNVDDIKVTAMVREMWKRTFEKPENRVPVWRY
jgi:hypothetical protein